MNQKTKKSANIIKITVLCFIMCALILGYYYHLTQKERAAAEKSPTITKVDEVLSRNLENDYPPTPKEVVKYYSEITRCFYNEEYSQGQLEELADKSRQLFDEELLAHNEWGAYIMTLQKEIDEYKTNEREISSYSVAASTDVEYFSMENREWAMLHCIYTLRQGGTYANVNEVFLLRRDEKNHWKIFGWELAKEDE